jgi:hypothetical protein
MWSRTTHKNKKKTGHHDPAPGVAQRKKTKKLYT